MIHYSQYDFKLPEIKTITKRRYRRKSIKYYNTPCTFDIETTSFYDNEGNKQAFCYLWSFCIEGSVIYGRTLEEFVIFINRLKLVLGVNDERRLIIYVHNLEFEFAFINQYFQWDNVFAREKRRPIQATTGGLCFKCSYMLTLLKLELLAEQLTKYHIEKLVGDLNFRQLRHSGTPLTQEELKYSENDVLLPYYFLLEEIEHNNNDITQIPLTKTGYVRRECREALQKNRDWWAWYKKRIDRCQPDKDLFILLNKAFQGGYTHANSKYVGLTLSNVKSIDFSSSYPTSMLFKKFPWKFYKKEIRTKEEFDHLIHDYCCVFECSFRNLKSKYTTTILSGSKCEVLENPKIDNGRLVSCDYALTYLTDLDFKNMQCFYTWDSITIGGFYWSKPQKLPRPLIEVILEKYRDKTQLKGVEGQERLYTIAKGLINGIYGMCVYNPLNDEIIYTGEDWRSEHVDVVKTLNKLVTDKDTFLLYQWGVWVSAWSRYELLQTVDKIENQVVYCDTDSIKYISNEYTEQVIANYNREQIEKNRELEKEYNYTIPTTADGVKAWLGIFDDEGTYKQFKTLGAKRYIFEKEGGKTGITISGLNKNTAGRFIFSQENPWEFFNDGMRIPEEATGKLTHTYIDEPFTGVMSDYRGVAQKVYSPSGVHLCEQDYTLALNPDFKQLFTIVQLQLNTNKSIDNIKNPLLRIGVECVIDSVREVFNEE